MIASFKERRAKMMEQFDTNKDGKLDPQEQAAMRAAMPFPPQILERFDTNKDGKLDDQEKAAMKATFQNKQEAPTAPIAPVPPAK